MKTFEYQPWKGRTTRTIIDEECSCHHRMTEHGPSPSPGHGPCTACACRKYTWVMFVYGPARERRARRDSNGDSNIRGG